MIGNLVFTRGKNILHKSVGIYYGISHVCVLYEKDGNMWVSSMSKTKNCITQSRFDEEWIKKWDYVIVLKIDCYIDHKKFSKFLEKKWTYSITANSNEKTYCTRHVCELMRYSYSKNIPIFVHPYSLFHYVVQDSSIVFEKGKRYDVLFLLKLLCISLIILRINIVLRKLYPRNCGCTVE